MGIETYGRRVITSSAREESGVPDHPLNSSESQPLLVHLRRFYVTHRCRALTHIVVHFRRWVLMCPHGVRKQHYCNISVDDETLHAFGRSITFNEDKNKTELSSRYLHQYLAVSGSLLLISPLSVLIQVEQLYSLQCALHTHTLLFTAHL